MACHGISTVYRDRLWFVMKCRGTYHGKPRHACHGKVHGIPWQPSRRFPWYVSPSYGTSHGIPWRFLRLLPRHTPLTCYSDYYSAPRPPPRHTAAPPTAYHGNPTAYRDNPHGIPRHLHGRPMAYRGAPHGTPLSPPRHSMTSCGDNHVMLRYHHSLAAVTHATATVRGHHVLQINAGFKHVPGISCRGGI